MQDKYLQFEADSADSGRRSLLRGLAGLAGLGFIAGCQGTDGDGSDGDGGDGSDSGDGDGGDGGGSQSTEGRQELHEFSIWYLTPDQGIDHPTGRIAAEAVAETPLPANAEAFKYSRAVDRAWFSHDFDLWYSASTSRIQRLDPTGMLEGNHHSQYATCGNSNVAHERDPATDAAVEEFRRTVDREERQRLVYEFQDKIARLDSDFAFNPYCGIADTTIPALWNSEKFTEPTSIPGIGVQNVHTFNNIEPKTGDTTLTYPGLKPSASMNPLASGSTNLIAQPLVYDTLVRLNPDGYSFMPWLATDWSVSGDGLTYTFNLREGHTFHDGEEVTAEDVVVTFQKQKGSPWWADGAKPFVKQEAVDKYTVKLTTEEPFAPALLLGAARVPIIPAHVWKDITPDSIEQDQIFKYPAYENDHYFGSGYMKFETWERESQVVLTANEDHFSPPNIDGMVIRVYGGSDAVLGAAERGEPMIIGQSLGVDPEVIGQLAEEQDHLDVKMVQSNGQRNYFMNMDSAPLNFDAVRAAISSVIPRQEIAANVRGPASEPVQDRSAPAVDFWHNDEKKKWGASHGGWEAGRQALEDAGFLVQDGTVYYPEGEAPESKKLEGYGCQSGG
jgi:peptide/nickel transport system substrate-binding protein